MAPYSEGDDNNNAVTSKPPTEETTATNRQKLCCLWVPWSQPKKNRQKPFTTSSETLTPPSLPSTSNPPPLPTLPFDLVVEILCRLPVKPLLRFQCICKSWKSLISDPKFAKNHLRGSPKDLSRHHLMLTLSLREFVAADYPFPSVFSAVTVPATLINYPLNTQRQFISIDGSCDGILCLNIDDQYHNNAILWNPSTQRFKKLPSLEFPQPHDCYKKTKFGFGYDHLSDSYKVVGVFWYGCGYLRKYRTQVKILTLGTDSSWRRIPEFPIHTVVKSGIFVSGTLNWLSEESDRVVVSLDLGKESYQQLTQPVNSNTEADLTVLRDCLCIIALHETEFSDVWLMKEYGNTKSWNKLFTISISYPNILHMSEEDEEVVMQESDHNLVLYNSRDGTCTPIRNFDDLVKDPLIYVESLISP